ncbi:hypothetical protein C0Q70_20054 [Pomacea canaliculata]|uniref:Ubiquitin-like domain-containing protein n=1 Tax=Pomacea canaliculata TaxID=400727 RepID=A0A2T7NEG2_POMCA|nr:hypothetical protein C0Q70_20054 [Pomacea canaliculata]
MSCHKIDVYVKIPTGRNAKYLMMSHDTIEKLCAKIAEEEKVKVNQVKLKYQGKILNEKHSMSYLGVRPETILKAEILVPRDIKLVVSLPKGLGEKTINTTNLETVSSVINTIAEEIEEHSSRISLKFVWCVFPTRISDAVFVPAIDLSPCPSTTDLPQTNFLQYWTILSRLLQAIKDSFHAGGRPVEVVFSFDTTGSMYSCLQEVRSKLRECCTRLIQDIPRIRIGVIAHGDYCDQSTYVIKSIDLTSDTQALVNFVMGAPSTSGGDTPECYEWVLRKTQSLDWSEEAAKALVVIGDCLPHPKGHTDQQVFWRDELALLSGMGVKVYGVQALDQREAVPFYQELAEASGGRYLRLRHFDVIVDMFLAVCYREADNDNLQAFVQEVEEAGRMTSERRELFRELERPSNAQSSVLNNQQRYVQAEWWDPSLETRANPVYHYDAARDKWIPIEGEISVPPFLALDNYCNSSFVTDIV